MTAEEYFLEYVSIYNIVPSTNQPRQHFEEADLESLAKSIRSVGLIQPLVAIKKSETEYELIAGERRWRAALRAGLESVPIVLKEKSHQAAPLIENIQRVDLNPIEIAQALKLLMKQSGLTQEKIAEQIGKKRSTVANYLRLLTLPKSIQSGVTNEKISMGHAKALLSIGNSDKQMQLFETIVTKGLTVRQAEEATKSLTQGDSEEFFLNNIANQLQKILTTAVRLKKKNGQAGEIIIEYDNWDELERLLTHLKISSD